MVEDATISSAQVTSLSNLGPLRQTYSRTEDFPKMARAYSQVSQTVKESGLLRRAPWFYAMVGALIALGFGGAITGFILLGDSWFQLLIAAAFGLLFTQVAFITHEAAHRQVLAKVTSNDRLARILAGFVGLSYSWWDSKHSRHHSNPNVVGKDPDIDVDTISFVQEDAAKSRGLVRMITRKQGWLFFPLLTLEGANLHFQSIKYLVSKEPVKRRWTEIGLITLRFALYLTPLFLFLPVGMAFAFLGVQLAVFGVYMGASFAPNHKGMPILDRDIRIDFFTKQVRTSRNISGGWWATWLMGGLNYQIEHHLFPNMPRPHLAKAREIVREYCATMDVPYTETTLLRSYGIVIEYLNRVGLAARDPFDCPITAEYRRG
ncbi:fatty acid desaturase family protein [Leucobacter sp. W1478]|uniref:fatty acid desaturase family protein n=1 Tax=Leucobacter sp. W1478 TaxID=3439065 RepID=UPI003F36A2B9